MAYNVGRPVKYNTKEEVQQIIDNYFTECEINNIPLTITGLGLALDMSRETLLRYGEKEQFSDTIKKAKQICQNFAEQYLYTGKNVAGAIFNLKNNYNWREEQSLNIQGEIDVSKKLSEKEEGLLDEFIKWRKDND